MIIVKIGTNPLKKIPPWATGAYKKPANVVSTYNGPSIIETKISFFKEIVFHGLKYIIIGIESMLEIPYLRAAMS